MSRREEVEASIKWIMSAGLTGGAITPNMRDLCRTLADERDEWKRRCEKMWRTIQLGAPLEREITIFMSDLDQQRWDAEGRDNG